jgi:hypothetical protein
MLFYWLMLAAVFSVGASAASVVEQPRNAGIFDTQKSLILRSSGMPGRNGEIVARPQHNVELFILRKVLIPGSTLFTIQCSSIAPAVGRFGRFSSLLDSRLRTDQTFPVQFHGATDSHSRVTGEERHYQRLKPFHLPQLLPVRFIGLHRPAWVGIEFNLSFQRGNRFPVLFQGVLLDFGGDVLKSLKFGKGKPFLKRIRFVFDSSTPLHNAINDGDEISPIERIDQRAMVGDDKRGNFSRGSIRHGVQRGDDNALQVSIHRCVKYALGHAPVQWISRNCGTTTALGYFRIGATGQRRFTQSLQGASS